MLHLFTEGIDISLIIFWVLNSGPGIAYALQNMVWTLVLAHISANDRNLFQFCLSKRQFFKKLIKIANKVQVKGELIGPWNAIFHLFLLFSLCPLPPQGFLVLWIAWYHHKVPSLCYSLVFLDLNSL